MKLPNSNLKISVLALLALAMAVSQTRAQIYNTPYAFTNLAGDPGVSGGANGNGSAAMFYYPASVAVDSAGNVYVADEFNDAIRKIDTAANVTTLAGTIGTHGSANGNGTAAQFYYPSGVAVDSAGNVYVADYFNHAIRKIDTAANVTTLAGLAGNANHGSADGNGSAAQFYYPAGVAVDSAGNVYVADEFNETIRKIDTAANVTTIAGTVGTMGYADGNGSAAQFHYPTSVAVDSAGNIYVADNGNDTIRKIDTAANVTTFAGTPGMTGSIDTTAGLFDAPAGVAVDSAGNVYVADELNNTIRFITPAGYVTTLAGTAGLAGTADGNGSAARFDDPTGVAVDSAGNVYVADEVNHRITKGNLGPPPQLSFTSANLYAFTNLAGDPGVFGSADGLRTGARFYYPAGVAMDSAGNVYVADEFNDTIRVIDTTATVTTLAGTVGVQGTVDGNGTSAQFHYPSGVAVDSAGNVYVSDYFNHTIRKIDTAANVTTLAGTAGTHGSADGNGTAALFYYPESVAVDSAGNVFVGDEYNQTIRKIDTAANVTTLAGSPGTTGFADGNGSAALFYYPTGVAVDGADNVFVTDTYNQAIRKIDTAGNVTTLAGDPGMIGFADGKGSAALFHYPEGLTVDGADNVFVADTYNYVIRKIDTAGNVTTLAGTATVAGAADGFGTAAQFDAPTGVVMDSAGNLYVADEVNHRITKGTPVFALVLSWPGGGYLQSSPNVAGPYGYVSGATSPFVVPITGPQNFFRILQ